MMTESDIEEDIAKLQRELRKLFISGANDQEPHARYAHANKIIEQAEKFLNSKNDHSELLDLFVELEASYQKAQTRRENFRSVCTRRGVKLD